MYLPNYRPEMSCSPTVHIGTSPIRTLPRYSLSAAAASAGHIGARIMTFSSPTTTLPSGTTEFYSEHYLIAAMLLCRAPPFRVLMPNYFVCMDIALGNRVKNIFRADNSPDIPFLYANNARIPGVPFWFETL